MLTIFLFVFGSKRNVNNFFFVRIRFPTLRAPQGFLRVMYLVGTYYKHFKIKIIYVRMD